jgi:prepilin-type processing-associated H-X9-DG protein
VFKDNTVGFTLVELLVMIAILGVLAALTAPALSRARDRAAACVCANNLRQIGVAFEAYLLENGHVYPAATDPVSVTPYYWLWMGRGWRKFLAEYIPGDKERPGVFYCISDTRQRTIEIYERTSYAYSMTFYHSPRQIDSTDSYTATFSSPMATVPQRPSALRFPSKKVLVGEWHSNHAAFETDRGWFAWGGTRLYLFADGHVESVRSEDLMPANDGLPDPNLTVGGIGGKDIL